MEIIVSYAGAEAKYLITPENQEGVFLAQLISYSGGDMLHPPKLLILMKAGEKWMGGAEELELIKALGDAIDGQCELTVS